MRYTISGDNMPVAICELDDGESLYCEAGAMSWMSPNLVMETKSKGGLGGFFGRALSGESGFQNYYTAKNGNGRIAFSSAYVGNILAVEITPDKPIIIQKRAFLAATMGVEMEIFFQKKLGTALFGGEGFVMQKLSGRGARVSVQGVEETLRAEHAAFRIRGFGDAVGVQEQPVAAP